MPEKTLLIVIRSSPHTTLDAYEGARVAAGLIEHRLKILYTGDGVYAATRQVDNELAGQFLFDTSRISPFGFTINLEIRPQ